MREPITETRKIFKKKTLKRAIGKFRDTRSQKNWSKVKFINGEVCLQDFKELFSEGEVAYGKVILANSDIYKEDGKRFETAVIMYSTDKHYDNGFSELDNLVGDLVFGMIYIRENDNKVAGNIRDICKYLSKGENFLNLKVSTSITRGRSVYITCIMIDRKQLPCGHLKDMIFPILAAPNSSKATMVLPKEYWGDQMLFEWIKKKAEK